MKRRGNVFLVSRKHWTWSYLILDVTALEKRQQGQLEQRGQDLASQCPRILE